jgi:hypothetical protein
MIPNAPFGGAAPLCKRESLLTKEQGSCRDLRVKVR